MAAELTADHVDARVVKALSHPTRARILNVLRDRELASPVELSAELDLALGTVGYHVRRLEELGFIELARRTQRRGAVEHHYRARQVLDEQLGDAESVGAGAWPGRAAEALAVMRTAQAALARGGFDALPACADRRVLSLDARGREELGRLLTRWQATVERIAHASSRRVRRDPSLPTHRCVAVATSFELPAGLDAD